MADNQDIVELGNTLQDTFSRYWQANVVFSFQWWIIVASITLPWVLWWRLVDRSNIKDISFFGLMIMLISLILDQMGTSLGFWSYPYTLTPIHREVWDPADLAILPVLYMLMYQWVKPWRSYFIAQVLFAFFAAYVGGNIYQLLNIYRIHTWDHIYSVPMYFLIGVFVKWFVERLTSYNDSRSK